MVVECACSSCTNVACDAWSPSMWPLATAAKRAASPSSGMARSARRGGSNCCSALRLGCTCGRARE
eukprot:933402-Prymnesium_polylepis.1